MANKLLLKAMKNATTREEALELINEAYPEVVKEEEPPKADDTVKVEPKTPEPVVTEVTPVIVEPIVDNTALIARLDTLEKQNTANESKLKEWEDITNKLLADKPFGIVQKVQKKEIDNIYAQYDADLIIGK